MIIGAKVILYYHVRGRASKSTTHCNLFFFLSKRHCCRIKREWTHQFLPSRKAITVKLCARSWLTAATPHLVVISESNHLISKLDCRWGDSQDFYTQLCASKRVTHFFQALFRLMCNGVLSLITWQIIQSFAISAALCTIKKNFPHVKELSQLITALKITISEQIARWTDWAQRSFWVQSSADQWSKTGRARWRQYLFIWVGDQLFDFASHFQVLHVHWS